MMILSLFPGIGMLDRAFEEQGYCVVRGPDLLWGGDIHSFHPPRGAFEGVIGGPPCQAFSALRRLFKHATPAVDLIPEFVRVLDEAAPEWFLMENVPRAPVPYLPPYAVRDFLVRDDWVGGLTRRVRRFSYGRRGGPAVRLRVLEAALHVVEPLPAICAQGATWVPVRNGGSSKRKTTASGRVYGDKSRAFLEQAKVAQGLGADFDLPGMTVKAQIKAIGNGVPMEMGRAVARAIRAQEKI